MPSVGGGGGGGVLSLHPARQPACPSGCDESYSVDAVESMMEEEIYRAQKNAWQDVSDFDHEGESHRYKATHSINSLSVFLSPARVCMPPQLAYAMMSDV